MHVGYCSRSVCLSVCYQASGYTLFLNAKVPYRDPNAYVVWISLIPLSSPVLALFADSKLLDLTLCINRMLSVARYIR